MLTAVGLVADGDNRVSTFSGGMKRRLSVAIASVGSPKIIFLDEPRCDIAKATTRAKILGSIKHRNVLDIF